MLYGDVNFELQSNQDLREWLAIRRCVNKHIEIVIQYWISLVIAY